MSTTPAEQTPRAVHYAAAVTPEGRLIAPATLGHITEVADTAARARAAAELAGANTRVGALTDQAAATLERADQTEQTARDAITRADAVAVKLPAVEAAAATATTKAADAESYARQAEDTATSLDGLKDAVDATVAQSPADSAVAAVVGQSGTLSRAVVGDVVGLWSPSRALAKGQRVIAPNGATVVATEAHTTGPAYDDSLYLAPGAVGLTMTTYATKTDALKRAVYQESRDVMYAVDQLVAGTVYKSTSSGQTWTRMGATGFRIHTMTKIMGTGTLIAVELTDRSKAGQNPRVARSTDDGATWTQVTTLTHPGLGNQGILSPAPGIVLVAEYGNTGETVFSIRRSTDDGVTWTAVLSSPGTDGVNDPGHIHSIVYAPDGNILAFMDRSAPEVYKSSDLGVTWEKIGTATQQYHPNWVRRCFSRNTSPGATITRQMGGCLGSPTRTFTRASGTTPRSSRNSRTIGSTIRSRSCPVCG